MTENVFETLFRKGNTVWLRTFGECLASFGKRAGKDRTAGSFMNRVRSRRFQPISRAARIGQGGPAFRRLGP